MRTRAWWLHCPASGPGTLGRAAPPEACARVAGRDHRHDLDKEVGGRKVKTVEVRAARVVPPPQPPGVLRPAPRPQARHHRPPRRPPPARPRRRPGRSRAGDRPGRHRTTPQAAQRRPGGPPDRRRAQPRSAATCRSSTWGRPASCSWPDRTSWPSWPTAGAAPSTRWPTPWRGGPRGQPRARHERRTLLTDPTFVAGIGPVYSDEILWAGGLRWDRESDSLSAQEVRRLHRAIQVVREAVRLRGVSVGETPWLDLHGGKEFEPQLSVYQREGQPCRPCRTWSTSPSKPGRARTVPQMPELKAAYPFPPSPPCSR